MSRETPGRTVSATGTGGILGLVVANSEDGAGRLAFQRREP
jgi:hypothetical protein